MNRTSPIGALAAPPSPPPTACFEVDPDSTVIPRSLSLHAENPVGLVLASHGGSGHEEPPAVLPAGRDR